MAFKPVGISANSGTPAAMNPTDPQTSFAGYTKDITFTTSNARSTSDFKVETANASGHGLFTAAIKSYASNTVTVTVTFKGGGTYGGNDKNRNNSTKVMLSSLGGENSLTSSDVISANFPAASVKSGSAEELYPSTPTATVGTDVSFSVQYADGLGDFTLPTEFTNKSHAGDTWTIGTATGPNTNYETGAGTVTIPITFTSEGTEGSHTADITLGGVTVTVTAHVEAAATYDVKVLDADGTTELHKGEWNAAAMTAINSHEGATLVIARDIDLGSVGSKEFTKNTTIDLNGKTVTATLNAAGGLLKLNTAGKTLTITDSKTGGAINVSGNINGCISVVDIQKGSLNLIKGDLTAENANTSNGSEGAPLCAGVYLAKSAWSGGRPTVTMSMSGGSVTARRTGASGNYVYGICCCGTETNAASVDLTGGSVTATNTNGTYAVGVFCAGKSTISNMSITASSTQYAYAVFAHHISCKVVISGGTYTAITSGANTRGILTRGEVSIMDGTIIANGTDDVHGIYLYYGTAIINGGNITSTASTGKAYALSVNNGSNYTAKINGGTLTANGVTESQGVKLAASTSLITTGGTINANSIKSVTSAATVNAYGVYVVSGATADISGTTINATTGTSEVGLNNYAYGINNAGTLTLTNAKVNARSWHQWAYGVYTTKSTTITGCEVTATTSDIRANGLYIKDVSALVTATNSSFSADAGTTYAYGVYAETGSLTSSNCTYYAITRQTGASAAASSCSRGIYHTGASTVTLNGDDITATGHEDYSQGAYGLYSKGANAKAIVDDVTISATGVNTGYALRVEDNSSQTINSGRFKGQTDVLSTSTPGTIKVNGGFYSHKAGIATSYLPSGYSIYDVPADMAEKGQGYNYKVGSKSNPGINVCKIGSTYYKTLEEALVKVGNNQTIVMTADYTLPAGDYILPSGATLLVPKNSSQTTANGTSTSNRTTSTATRAPYKTLTFAKGAHLVCNGTIETGADLYCAGQYSNQGSVYGPFGHIKMEEGSLIELESGANLWSWGYVTGAGTIDAKNGSKILEDFQIANWPGGTNASNMIENDQNVMPIDQYFIQNIECDVIFRPGASEVGATGVNMSFVGMKGTNDIRLVGKMNSESLFLMDENDANPDTWVKKSYDKTTDYIIWTVNSGASIGKLTVSISGYAIESEKYTLPMANNMKIILNYGNVKLTQDLVFLPGSELVINKEAIGIAEGAKLYFYDHDDWVGKMYYSAYSPSWSSTTTNPRKNLADKDKDAKLFAKGMMKFSTSGSTKGGPYTTSHGADICSTNEDAGVIVFGSGALADDVLYYLPTSGSTTTGHVSVTTAQLHNGSGYATAYESTVGTTASQMWGYLDNHWVKMTRSGCLYETVDGSKTYAYPSSFLEVEQNNPDDHAWHGVTETNRYVINTKAGMNSTDCVWWDAQPEEDGDYMVTNEGSGYTNAIFHYNSSNDYWEPYIFNITFNNGTTALGTSRVYKNVQPKFTGRFVAANGTVTTAATPSKSADTYYYYTWDGWVTNNANATADEPNDKSWVVYSNDEMPRAKANVSYYAHFKKTGKQYMITFKDEDGSQLQQGVQNAGSTAVYNGPTPTKASTDSKIYTFNGWSPSLAIVSAAATYTATYSETNRPYTIVFANYNGDKLQEAEVAYGSAPTYDGAEPTRANSGFWSYNFRGWRAPNGDEYNKDETLPAVSGTTTYTALYTETDWTPEYTITFKDGDNKVLTTQYVRQGNTPEYAGVTPTKTATAQYTYTFNNTWSPAISAATADKTYTAQFDQTTNTYTITFTDENDVVKETKSVAYGATPTYTGSSLAKAQDDEYTYELVWSPVITSVTGDKTYKATYNKTKRSYTITWKDGGGNTITATNVEYGVTPSYTGATPTKSATAQYKYAFAGWFPALRAVTGDMTYQAQFSSTLQSYTVTWKNGDTTLETDENVPYGTTPTYNSATPTKDQTAEYTYTFSSWDPAPEAVTAAATYTAQFNEAPRSYSVTLNTNEGTINSGNVTSYTYGTDANLPTNVTRTGYDFNGWYDNSGLTGSSVKKISATATGNKTYWAKWTVHTHKFAWDFAGGSTSSTTHTAANNALAYGCAISYPADNTMTKTGYTFASWSSSATAMPDEDLTITANWTINPYTITFDSNGGSDVSSITQNYGTSVTAPADPTRTGYTFKGWTPAVPATMPASNTECVAQWTPNTNTAYTVEHYWQNINDDNYTKHETVNMTGTTDAATEAVAKSYDGFEAAQPFVQGTVAPDGSTVVKIYYNRKTYLIKWDVKLNGEQEAYKEETLRYGATPSYGSTPTKEQTESQVFTFSGWDPVPYEVDKDQTYNGSFNVSPHPYTITFVNDNDAELTSMNVGWGISPDYNVTPISTVDPSCGFVGWKATSNSVVYAANELPKVGTNALAETYTATYNCVVDPIVVVADATETVEINTTTTITTVKVQGKLQVDEDVTLTTDDLILEGSADDNWKMNSGEILLGEGTVNATNAYYDMSPEGGYQARIWYAVAVPWTVSVPKNEVGDVYDADGHQLRLNIDFDLLYYNGATRATGSTSNWNSVAKDGASEWVMKPGMAYMIYLANPTTKLRFKKSSGVILTSNVSVKKYDETTGNDGKDANWNGIANPALYHAYLNAGTDGNWGQVFVPGNAPRESGTYATIDMSSTQLVVGQPVFVQAEEDKSVVAYSSNTDYASHAPRRVQQDETMPNVRYAVEIASNGKFGDRIFVLTNEDKEDVYTIGQDVAKLGSSSTKPQMWVNRYDTKLCVNTMPLTAKKATYPLSISVPADGDYELYIANEIQEGQDLYVTYNNRMIWNLTYGPFTASLSKGTHTEYGLKLVQSPMATTGLEDGATINEVNGVRKVLIDNTIYIIREGVVYTINGQQVQ